MKVLRFLALLTATGVVVGGIVMLLVFAYFGRSLPDDTQLRHYEPSISTRLYAKDGRMFAEYAYEKRVFVPVSSIPDRLKNAFIAVEDKNFYDHVGVDFGGILKAIIRNIKKIKDGRRMAGASTITQQVARNFLLQETARIVSWERKIKEMILSFRLEAAFTKDHILELYLNEIFLGKRSYGVGSAALNYFNKSLSELNLAECAFLAALPKAPSRYSNDLKRARIRRDYVLERMYEEGFITEQEMKDAQKDPIKLNMKRYMGNNDTVEDDYFAEEVRRIIVDKFGKESLYRDGLVVRSSMDPEIQNLATRSLQQGLIKYDRRHGWRGAVSNYFKASFYKDNHKENDDNKNNDKAQELEYMIEFLKTIKKSKKALDVWDLAIVTDVTDDRAYIAVKRSRPAVIASHVTSSDDNSFLSSSSSHVIVGSSIRLQDTKWARKFIDINTKGDKVKSLHQVVKRGDVIYVESVDDGKDERYHRLVQIPQVSGAIVVMNIHTGQVLAMSGGFNYRHSQFNRATQAMRQAGSTFKPFVALTALEKGLTPASLIDDSPISIYLGEGRGVWRPKNMSGRFYGPITLRRVIENSHNVATVRLVHEILGIGPIVEVAHRFGIYDNLPPLLSMVLGAGETTLLRLTAAFASLVNSGKQVRPSFIDRIQDRYGKTILLSGVRQPSTQSHDLEWSDDLEMPRLEDKSIQLTDPIYAYQIVSILEGAAIRGTSWKAGRAIGKTIGGKTGTTNDSNTLWYIGFTPDIIVGTYVGFDTLKSLGKKESGSSVAMPIFVDFMKEYLKDKPSKPFRAPSGIKLIKVRRDSGKRPTSFGKGLIITEAFKENFDPGFEVMVDKNETVKVDQIASGGLY